MLGTFKALFTAYLCKTENLKINFMTIKTPLLLATLALGLYSCDPCRNLDCQSSSYSGQFSFLSKQNGLNLVFGLRKVYDKTKIKFYSINKNDTTYYDYTVRTSGIAQSDSILDVSFYPAPTANVYIKLSNSDTDTLAITFKTFTSQCCGKITEIDKFLYNNSTEFSGSPTTKIILK